MVQGASQQGSFTVERVPRQFKTARLDLGPFELSDAKRVVELAGDWDVARWTASIPHPYFDRFGSTVDRSPGRSNQRTGFRDPI
jgi:hypothetical protein